MPSARNQYSHQVPPILVLHTWLHLVVIFRGPQQNGQNRSYSACAANVLSVLLYASETWTLLKDSAVKLQGFLMMNQRRILGIHWYDFVRNEEVARLSELPPIINTISQRRHALFDHVRRMDQAAFAHQDLHLSVTT